MLRKYNITRDAESHLSAAHLSSQERSLCPEAVGLPAQTPTGILGSSAGFRAAVLFAGVGFLDDGHRPVNRGNLFTCVNLWFKLHAQVIGQLIFVTR